MSRLSKTVADPRSLRLAQKLRAGVQKELDKIPALVPDTDAILIAFLKVEDLVAR